MAIKHWSNWFNCDLIVIQWSFMIFSIFFWYEWNFAGVNGVLTIKNGDMSGKCIPVISDIAMGNPRTTVNGGLNMFEWEIHETKSEISIGMFDSPLRKVNATVPLLSLGIFGRNMSKPLSLVRVKVSNPENVLKHQFLACQSLTDSHSLFLSDRNTI